jgi:hypothetical protein
LSVIFVRFAVPSCESPAAFRAALILSPIATRAPVS